MFKERINSGLTNLREQARNGFNQFEEKLSSQRNLEKFKNTAAGITSISLIGGVTTLLASLDSSNQQDFARYFTLCMGFLSTGITFGVIYSELSEKYKMSDIVINLCNKLHVSPTQYVLEEATE